MSTEQQFHYLTISSSLGQDALIPEQLTVSDKISGIFSIKLSFVANQRITDLEAMIGEPITIALAMSDTEGSARRYFHGHIRYIKETGGIFHNRDGLRYRATLVPKVWFASQRINCRIFQHLSVIDIVNQLLGGEHGATVTNKTAAAYSAYDYCVQYHESDWDFCRRLLAAEGIFYYFNHSDGAHELIIADHAAAYTPALQSDVEFRAGSHSQARISNWLAHVNTTVAATAWRHFDFTTPEKPVDATATQTVAGNSLLPREVFLYQGESPLLHKSTALSDLHLDSFTQQGNTCEGHSNCRSFACGHTFTFADHQQPELIGQSFVITAFTLTANLPSNLDQNTAAQDFYYENQFVAMPSATVFRPQPLPKPVIAGLQTATVTGSPGEEIHTDNFGRVKVQFHWDREGTYDENSSCWVRVAHSWAGAAFGAQFIPRVGHEVVVEFINGDPDQPLITGALYNGKNTAPYPLPDQKNHSGIKSRSTLGGSDDNYNELCFIDTLGSEQFIVHAEKDQLIHVENDRTGTVGHNDIWTITNDQIVDAGNTITITAGSRITLTCGAASLTMDSSGNITLSGSTLKLEGSATVDADAPSITLN